MTQATDNYPRALLLSAYDAQSHRYWRRQLCQGLPDWQWTELSLPPRYFSWRQRGNSLSWAFKQRDILTQDYEFLLATSMVDLSALRGFVPELARLPTVLYFHENQFAYPQSTRQHSPVEPQLTSIYSALCADSILFNSQFNLDSFMAGARALLKAMPDHVPKGLMEQLSERARVLPVPISPYVSKVPNSAQVRRHEKALRILWNHRWEYDKGPERLLAAIERLDRQLKSLPEQERPDIRWLILGQSFRNVPEEFAQIQRILTASDSPMALEAWGYEPCVHSYQSHMHSADVVLSTAEHDFQGLAILEAQAEGCYPLLPKRLVYPEWFDESLCYPSSTIAHEAEGLAAEICKLAAHKIQQGKLPEVVSRVDFDWSALGPDYQRTFHSLRKKPV
ncbi:tRNA-queuosine alpha-mannosyltransferase domain-containing protein [Pseudoteredinibacter isoporae]|uniref:tRNA-queuosine alpha-mannosyltransferase domain-containing protein n=1 Tax=Pseudoteredinibacter isoporae TaxID=570281 RepID=UPI0031050B76